MNESQQAFQKRPREDEKDIFRQANEIRSDLDSKIDNSKKNTYTYTTAAVDRNKYGYSYRFADDGDDPYSSDPYARDSKVVEEDPSAEYPDYLKLNFDDVNYVQEEPEYRHERRRSSSGQDTASKLKETLTTLLMGFISGFFILSFMAFFGELTSVFMLLCALLTVPLRHVKTFRKKYLTPAQSGILATILFIIGVMVS